ncbi:MAG: hypothetical protein JO100_12345 [Pseudonocardia sp.]|nr:hypothetical protein [Pseudonocardia sp.]
MDRTANIDRTRAEGPVELHKGPVEVAAVVVLDPSGEAKHGGLPATWRPLTENVGVVWCRLPAARRVGLAGDRLLPNLANGRQQIHLVGVGSAGLLAVALAMSHRDLVRSLIVVDPPWSAHDLAEVWRFIDDDKLLIYQIETTTQAVSGIDGDTHATLPIGHPDVVQAIVQVLVAADAGLVEGDRRPPGAKSLATEAWHALRAKLSDALEAFA